MFDSVKIIMCHVIFTYTFMHLAEDFIRSKLQQRNTSNSSSPLLTMLSSIHNHLSFLFADIWLRSRHYRINRKRKLRNSLHVWAKHHPLWWSLPPWPLVQEGGDPLRARGISQEVAVAFRPVLFNKVSELTGLLPTVTSFSGLVNK